MFLSKLFLLAKRLAETSQQRQCFAPLKLKGQNHKQCETLESASAALNGSV